MKILFINAFCGTRSTGRICTDLARQFEQEGHIVKIAYGRDPYVPEQFRKYAVQIGTPFDVRMHGIRTRLLDEHGFGSVHATKKFLEWAETFKPDLLWLHNLHGYYINVELLFQWIKKHPEMEVRWTLHDCWAFTGHCAYFSKAQCYQWKTECKSCTLFQKKSYPATSFKSNCKKNFARKKAAFTGVKNMSLITPSKWLAGLVEMSYLHEYPIRVVYNTIDTGIFKPTPSDFRKKYDLENKKIILGVANIWDERKGLEDIFKLAQKLNDRYAIVLVGMDDKQIAMVPQKLEGLECKKSKDASVALYTPGKNLRSECNHAPEPAANLKEDIEVMADGSMVVPQGNINAMYLAVKTDEDETLGGQMPCVICIKKTANAIELAKIYTAADVLINPTYEDNYPTVNLEARACGTPVVTYDTGGCRETLVADYIGV